MNKRTRFFTGTVAMVMTLRYSEIGYMVASAENGILYSLNESITINAGTVDIKGLLYAPNGTVNINADKVNVSGLIIAKNIVINASQIEESPDRDLKTLYDTLRMEYHLEITAACLEENKIELYGGHINITEMNIYIRENNATDFKLLAETTGNEYAYTPAEDVETLDIIEECTNVYEQTAYSSIVSFKKADGMLKNTVIDTDKDGMLQIRPSTLNL